MTCSPWAARQGVVAGMPLAEAQALCETTSANETPATHFENADPAADANSLRELARTCEPFTPLFGIEESESPECLLLDVTGAAHLFGGESGIVEAIATDFRRRGFQVRAAMAPTIGAAWAAARHVATSAVQPVVTSEQLPDTLSPLPVESLRLSAAILVTLHELGLRRVGQLRALPRESLPSRFGPLLLKRLDQAFGDEPELLVSERPIEPLEATWVGEFPLTDRESLRLVVIDLLEQLLPQLQPRRAGVRQLLCRLSGTAGRTDEFVTGFLVPTDNSKHIRDMLSLQIERSTLPDEIMAVRLEVTATDSLIAKQRDLFGHELDADTRRDVAALIDRLSNRLGTNAVVRTRLIPESQPELAAIDEPWLTASGWHAQTTGKGVGGSSKSHALPGGQGRATQPARTLTGSATGTAVPSPVIQAGRPLKLLSPPQSIEVSIAGPEGAPLRFFWDRREHRVIRSWGPERIESGWWRESSACRDYFRVEVQTGHHFWLFRRLDERDWFIHGTFD